MDRVNSRVRALFAAKKIRRRKLAALPFPDKVQAVVRLQRMVAPPLARTRKTGCRVGD
jgi:hypothetical protein